MHGRAVVVHGWLNNILTLTPKAMLRLDNMLFTFDEIGA